jgi:hypothetical protein
VARAEGKVGDEMTLAIPSAKLWSPEHPFLYDLKVSLKEDGRTIDTVASYFGMRQFALGKDPKGITRLMLNGKQVFQVGPLDQGFWPDGIYTAPTDEALRYDIEITKNLGFNVTRKHVKVEPERWYYWCDRLGLPVWQDMPSGENRTAETQAQFERELRQMIHQRRNHPCIVMWIVFNEGWGQFDTPRLVKLVKDLDPDRLVSNATGGHDKRVGDIVDIHAYPGPQSPRPEARRAAALGEFGGLGLPIPGHTWTAQGWGYREVKSADQLTSHYVELLAKVYQLRTDPGLSAAIYTQITDVETELNGLLTYDRAVVKMNADQVARANRGQPPLLPAKPEPK